MAKKDKKVARATREIPEGMKCFQKIGGGSYRTGNRIIKPGQRFWTYPESLPKVFKAAFKEVAADYGAVVVEPLNRPRIDGIEEAKIVPEKFEIVKAVDEEGNEVKKGDSFLYNVVGEDGKTLNEKPLRKKKAEELLETLNA